MYRKNVALWCGCSIPMGELLDSSAVGSAQLKHTADESILCVRDGNVALPKLLWDFLLTLLQYYLTHSLLFQITTNLTVASEVAGNLFIAVGSLPTVNVNTC